MRNCNSLFDGWGVDGGWCIAWGGGFQIPPLLYFTPPTQLLSRHSELNFQFCSSLWSSALFTAETNNSLQLLLQCKIFHYSSMFFCVDCLCSVCVLKNCVVFSIYAWGVGNGFVHVCVHISIYICVFSYVWYSCICGKCSVRVCGSCGEVASEQICHRPPSDKLPRQIVPGQSKP